MTDDHDRIVRVEASVATAHHRLDESKQELALLRGELRDVSTNLLEHIMAIPARVAMQWERIVNRIDTQAVAIASLEANCAATHKDDGDDDEKDAVEVEKVKVSGAVRVALIGLAGTGLMALGALIAVVL